MTWIHPPSAYSRMLRISEVCGGKLVRTVHDEATRLNTLCNQRIDIALWLVVQIVVATHGFTTWNEKDQRGRIKREKRTPTNKGPRDRTCAGLLLQIVLNIRPVIS